MAAGRPTTEEGLTQAIETLKQFEENGGAGQRAPSGYQHATQLYGFGAGTRPSAEAEMMAGRRQLGLGGWTQADSLGRYVYNKAGNAIMYSEGRVIVDLEQGQVFWDESDEEAEGSRAWLRTVRRWDEKKVNRWRQKLNEMGWQVGPSGAPDETFLESLRNYHEIRYKNFGEETPLDQPAGTEVTMPDKAQIRNTIESSFRSIGLEPTSKDLEMFERQIWSDIKNLQINKGLPAGEAIGAAEARFARSMEEDPEIGMVLEDQEENTDFMDSMRQAASLGDFMSRGT